jgi:hypothetical protein
MKELSCMQKELIGSEDLDLWLEDDLTAERLPTVVSASLMATGGSKGCGGCGHGCGGCGHGCGGCKGCGCGGCRGCGCGGCRCCGGCH